MTGKDCETRLETIRAKEEGIMRRKIAFFDIDDTLTSEKDGCIPDSTKEAIRKAHENGHLLFINSGRTCGNVEERFRVMGFDGYVFGCGTNIFYGDKELLHIEQSHERTMEILRFARETGVDLLFESKKECVFDWTRPFQNPMARQFAKGLQKRFPLQERLQAEDFVCDKFGFWAEREEQAETMMRFWKGKFECIDRGGSFYECIPYGYSKATGIQFLLDYFGLDKADAYAFGDSTNDLAMLEYVPNSVAMGNAKPKWLFERVSYVTDKASEDGIYKAMEHFSFF